MGRLTRDPETRYSAQGQGVGRFSLAVDRRFKREGQPDADFFDCVCFGRQAEFMEKYLKKGTKVVINGSIQNNNYQDRTGQMVYRQQIVCDNIEFAESKASSQQHAGAYQAPQQQAAPAQAQTPAPDISGDGFMNIPDGIEEELPFS
jgi:single-strand DNA-binding protein